MLFAPRAFHRIDPHPLWTQMQENADRIVSREAGKFLGYCRRQALVYGLKGERVKAAEKALAVLEGLIQSEGHKARLGPHIERVLAETGSEHVSMETRTMQTGRVIPHLRVAGKLAAATVTLAEARVIADGVVKEYGARSRRAMESSGKDWKALSHALRIGYEAVELFGTGRITLPRPEAPRLLEVKRGLVDADEVGAEIVALLDKVESGAENSPLPEAADMEYLEGFVAAAHYEAVTGFPEPDAAPSCRA